MSRSFLPTAFCIALLASPTLADSPNVSLFYSADNLIYRANSDGSGRTAILGPSQPGWWISKWVIDEVNQRIYSAELPTTGFGNTRIVSATLDGSDLRTVYDGFGLGQMNYGMAVDGARGYLFLHSHDAAPVGAGPHYDGRIQRISIPTGELFLFPQTVWYARIDVDTSLSRIYYSDVTGFASGGPSIYNLNGLKYATYDGADVTSVAISGQTPASEIAIAGNIGSVFFEGISGGIYSGSLAGGNASFVAPTTGTAWIDYDSANNQLYWLDSTGIHRSAANGDAALLVVEGSLLGTSVSGLQVATVPEPSTYAMALAGLGCVSFAAMRRRDAPRAGC